MTRTLRTPAGVPRAVALALLALAAAVLCALTLNPARAEAAFTTAQCEGADITGRGASFARDAHNVFRTEFEAFSCDPNAPTVDYEALGSGAGLESVGARLTPANADGSHSRDVLPRFGMTDDPPQPQEVIDINRGTDATGDEDKIHVIPAAVGAVAPLVNFPNNCDVSLLPAAERTASQDNNGDTVPDGTVRVRFTKVKFEAAWAKDSASDNWTELFPELAPDADCNVPIIRIVRFDRSGTTFAFKDSLDTMNPTRGWIDNFTGSDNRAWPNATVGVRDDAADSCPAVGTPPTVPTGPGREANAIDQLTSGCSNGNGSLVTKLIATDGSIGYSDISTARVAGLAVTPRANAGSAFDNDTYWTQGQNGNGCADRRNCPANGDFVEPTFSANGFRTDGPKGSNCQSTTFTGVPSTTLGDWADVSGVNAPSGYGACTLTYGLLFDDYAKAYAQQPSQTAEEAKARTVKDYWTTIVNAGQGAALFGQDYASLPAGLLTIARAGVNAVGWNKTGGGGGPGPGPGPGGGGNTPIVPSTPALPSNVFSVPRTSISSSKGTATFSFRLPGAGTLVLDATGNVAAKLLAAKRFKVGRLRLTVSKAGTYKLTLKPSKAAKRVLRRKGKLKVKVKVTFTPRGGKARSSTRTVTLKLKRRKASR